MVPTATTWLTGFLVTWAPVWLRDSSLPSTHTSSKVTLCSPATPLVVVFLVPLARVASSWLVTPNATAWVSLTDFFSTRLIVTARPSVSGVSGAGLTRSCAPRVTSSCWRASATVGPVLATVLLPPSTLTVTFLGVVMVSARPERPSGSDRDTDSFAESARIPSSARAASTEVAVVQ